ncbi:aminoglycoside phosphotransferase family protein [Chryseobacterium potabilaquae]|uniref:Homoserine kinase n=1 Tax=Chryseobacterium potabilaquae TaxID=2675057 RepID=A0A6N4XBA4_9FLAO|nr:aminoglycoside phosphotransferase family protein [Chryseobacterium potabilaquae]CAA7197024.1 Homoserine kinase [Chryseobacterium potabilaquae]
MNSVYAQQFLEKYLLGKPFELVKLPQSGSTRINFLAITDDKKYIITYNENIQENESFFYFSQIFSQLQLNTPQVLAISEDRNIYIQDFLGENTLSEIISEQGLSDNVRLLVSQTLEKLFHLQIQTKDKIDYSKTFEYEAYDQFPIMHDLYYFKNFVVDILELDYHKSTLLKEFQKITCLIEKIEPKGLMIRDFQARNIMVSKDHEISFIDYQGAMYGPFIYDVISFLFQAKANFSEIFKNEMLEFYIQKFEHKESQEQLRNSIKPIQMMRFLQVLGAYGFRGLIQRKSHFIESIEIGIENITKFAYHWETIKEYPELEKVILQLNTEKTKLKIKDILNS